jgi:hypothetical protein
MGLPSIGILAMTLRRRQFTSVRLPLETGSSLGLNPPTWGGKDPYGRLGDAPSPAENTPPPE